MAFSVKSPIPPNRQDARRITQECANTVTQEFPLSANPAGNDEDLEFHISVTPVGSDEYLVRTERVFPGVPLAEEQLHWPVEQWLEQARQLMSDPVFGILQNQNLPASMPSSESGEDFDPRSPQSFPPIDASGDRGAAESSARNLIALGQQLYNALFQGSLRDSWMMAQGIAQHRQQMLRLRLGLKGNRLPRLPWEVLHDGDRTLATGTDVLFSRYQPNTGNLSVPTISPQSGNRALRILMAIAAPTDQESLELKREATYLQEELQRRARNSTPDRPRLELSTLEQPDRALLAQALEQSQYQVLHYAGHSNFGISGGDVYLVSSKTGLTETLSGDDLAGLLVNNGIQMAVFNSCRGAYTAKTDPLDNRGERNLAETLVKRGIPGVLAMAERIPDEVALTLTRLLYRNLNQGYPVDLSLSRARQGLISAYGSDRLYWALPILYFHPDFDGYLTKRRSGRDSEIDSDPFEPFEPVSGSGGFGDDTDPADEADLDGVLDEIEYGDMSNAEDAAMVGDLLRELAQPDESPSPAPSETRLASDSPSDRGSVARSPHQNAIAPTESPTPVGQSADMSKPSPFDLPPSRSDTRLLYRRQHPWLNRLLWAIGLIALVAIGVWVVRDRSRPTPEPQVSPSPTVEPTTAPALTPDRLSEANTADVTLYAIEQFNRDNLENGQKAVEALLDRGALQQASAALDPVKNADNAEVYFLRGRLAWQFVQSGNQDYSIDDARRYWETALRSRPGTLAYLEALGFAYYAEGKVEQAYQTWLDAVKAVAPDAPLSSELGAQSQAVLDAYGGLALALMKTASERSPAEGAKMQRQAVQLRQQILSANPSGFQPEALGQNWLWTQQAIRDWQQLLEMEV